MPGDHVLSGELRHSGVHIFPLWVLRRDTAISNENVAFVRMPNSESLITDLVPFHNGNNSNVDVYRCFIKTRNNTIFGAFLENNNNAIHYAGDSRVFVHILGHDNPVFSGFLHHAEGHPPAWLL